LLVSHPERVAGAIIIDPLGAFVDAMDEFGERLVARVPAELQDRLAELDAREDEGHASAEESQELQEILWLGYFANPAAAPPRPPMRSNPKCGSDTIASIRAHGEQATLERGLPLVPALPVLFIHGEQSPMPVRATTETAALIPNAQVELIEDAGHYLFLEQPERTLAVISHFVDAAA
jgi:pimeloyl-ACP methyl ester carboxylesterase